MLCFFADPKIYIFPRTRKLLCNENSDTKKLEFKKLLDTFEDSNLECPLGKNKFKAIETKIYADFAKEVDENTVKVSRYFSVGYLKKQNDDFFYYSEFNKHNHSLEVIAKCNDSNIECSLKWCNDRNQNINNEDDNSIPIKILPTGYIGKYSLQDVLLTIKFPKNLAINNQEIIIEVKKANSSKTPEKLSFYLYKNTQSKIKDFDYQTNPIKDFFVIPTSLSLSKNQENIILELQKLNNQVLARNKKMDANFCFLAETGQLDDERRLIENIKNSIQAFKTSVEDPNAGCKSDVVILGTSTSGIKINYPYNFENFGQDENLLNYLFEIYKNLDNEGLKGIVIDKNYLFGNYLNGGSQNQIEGVKNLYDFIVIPFIDTIINHAKSYLDFKHRWMSCPKYNYLYQRGIFETKDATKKLYVNENGNECNLLDILNDYSGEDNALPEGTKLEFESGSDLFAFQSEAHMYKIKSVKLPGLLTPKQDITAWISLTLEEKKTCDDSVYNQNFSNYTEIASTVANTKDKEALNKYKESNGIPYYINGMDQNYNGNPAKLKSETLLGWNENPKEKKNWYSYEKKPNTKDFGIDCSGLISNCINSFKYKNQVSHFYNIGNYFQNLVGAVTIRDELCRFIPLIENTDSTSFCQKGDILVSHNHIVFCWDDNNIETRVSMNKLITAGNNKKYFTIIHSCGNFEDDGENKGASWVGINLQQQPQNSNDGIHYYNGFFLKTLKGPFRHWGRNINLVNNSASDSITEVQLRRIYLWY